MIEKNRAGGGDKTGEEKKKYEEKEGRGMEKLNECKRGETKD